MARRTRRRTRESAPSLNKDRPEGRKMLKETKIRKRQANNPRKMRGFSAAWHVLTGRPLKSSETSGEKINPVEGLSALSLDALTSVAYGPEAIIVVLALAGSNSLNLVLPITVVIVVLLAILIFSYTQVIDAYPGGGGAYAVSRANLGKRVSLIAGAALIVDYTLTVAVSIAAGTGALVSAFPFLAPETVPICLLILSAITIMNLRGLGETARAFLLPTMVFIVGLYAIIAIGLIHPFALHTPMPGQSLIPNHPLQTLGILLILKAFSAGCSALTGVEAIANGVPLFKEPRTIRAKRTELLLGMILGSMLLGLAVLARRWHIGPRTNQTVLSQIMATAVGRHWAYYLVSITITVVLALAANTSYGGLPILASLLAKDNYLPHRFSIRGDRQVFTTGIWALTILSAALLIGVNGNTETLIPLFAIGVFTGFTLSQSGLVVHWWKSRPPHWHHRVVINGFGAIITAGATVVFLVSKFTQGAWIVVVVVPIFIWIFVRIHAYYDRIRKSLSPNSKPKQPKPEDTLVIVPVTEVSKVTEHAISEAMSLGQEVIAITVAFKDTEVDEDPSKELVEQWQRWDPGIPLQVLYTEYASIVTPIVDFIDEVRKTKGNQIVVLIPVIVPNKARYRFLHNQTDFLLTNALRTRTDLVVARAKFPVGSS